MTIGSRIKERRKELGLSVEDVAAELGKNRATIYRYENSDIENMPVTILAPLASVLQTTLEYLMGWDDDPNDYDNYDGHVPDAFLGDVKGYFSYLKAEETDRKNELDEFYVKQTSILPSEMNLIERYRDLDDTGRNNVDIALDRESDRVKVLKAAEDALANLQSQMHASIEVSPNTNLATHVYTYLRKIVCAGTSFTFDEIPSDTIEAPYMEGADFIIGVNGDSMEPDYHDGDMVYVKKTESLNTEEVGIFTINDTCFIKELGEDGLISHNKDYEDIPGTEDVRLIGKVLGKVE